MTRNQVLSTLRERMWRKRFAGGGEPSLPWAIFTGNPVQFTAPRAHTLRSTSVAFTPIQDLHGYANPWPAGGGDNKLVFTIANLKSVNTNGTWSGNTYTINGVSYAVSVDDAGNTTGIVASNTATANAVIDVGRNETILPAGTYYIPSNNSTTNVNYIVFKVVGETATSLGGVNSFTLTEETSIFIRYVVSSGNTPSGTIKPMLCTTSTSEPFAPYSNLCPISGWTALDIYDEPDYDPTAQPMTTLSFGQTVYGGTAEVAEDGTATGSDEWANIASYNGETITEPWLSSMDKYVSGATPTTGAQVVYKKYTATPFTPTVTGQPTAVKGINTIWTDGDSLTVEARAEAVNLSASQSLNMLLGGRYVNNHTEEDLTDEEALSILLGGEK